MKTCNGSLKGFAIIAISSKTWSKYAITNYWPTIVLVCEKSTQNYFAIVCIIDWKNPQKMWHWWRGINVTIFILPEETSQELRMLSPSFSVQRSQCNCPKCHVLAHKNFQELWKFPKNLKNFLQIRKHLKIVKILSKIVKVIKKI